MLNSDRAVDLLTAFYTNVMADLGPARAAKLLQNAFTPDAQRQILAESARQIAAAEPAAPQVHIDFDNETLTCPYLDCAVRENIKATDQRVCDVGVYMGYLVVSSEDRDLKHTGFHCGSCGRPVSAPEGIDIEENY